MSSKNLAGTKIAFLAANGFNEKDLNALQRLAMQKGAKLCIISPEAGLVNGWTGEGWGHHYAIDATLSSVLGADYDALYIVGGSRSIDKLKLTAHTRRFVSSFINAHKPVAVSEDAVHILALTDMLRDRTVNGPDSLREVIEAAGGIWSDESPCYDNSLVSGSTADFPASALDFFASCEKIEQAA